MLLKNGDSGLQVKYLQQGLRIMCCNPGNIDSVFGPGTQAAVQKFQEEQGLAADGIVGDNTWDCLTAEIKPIQRALKDKGGYSGSITGIAKDSTYNAVLKFQENCQLKADGMVGAATRERLFNTSSGSDEDTMLPLTMGSRGDYVLNLQYGLRILCCSPGALDGVFGSGTESAVKKFQGKYRLNETGIVDSDTWKQLKNEIRSIQRRLDERGYSIANVDGLATSALVETIKTFQEDNWLTADGQVGPSTFDVLFDDVENGATDALPLKLKSRGPQVLYFQYALRINCFNPNGTDGIFGAGMQSAVNRYKTGKGLPADGMVDTKTWETMREDIRPIQTALAGRGYEVGFIDGIATDDVYAAVLQFQRDNNLTADGMVGTSTKNMLLGGTSGGGTVSSTLKTGSNGSLTRYLQLMLNELGYNVTVDGIFKESTYNAIADFQRNHSLDADGIVGGGTWRELFKEYHVSVSGTGVERLVNVAKHELDWHFAEDNANNITPYGQWYELNGSAWCAMFVSFCAFQAGVLEELVPKYAWCPSGKSWYKSRQRYHAANSGYVPKIGDIIFFYNNELGRVAHTGIVVDGDETHVTTIEGNTSIDAVEKRTYSRNHSTIDGYGDNGGEPIEQTVPPTTEEIEAVLADYYKEFLDICGLVIPSYEIKMNRSFTVPMPPNAKIVVEASGSTTLYDNILNNPTSMSFDITDGIAASGGIKLGDYMSLTLNGMDVFVNTQSLLDIITDINTTVETGFGAFGSGVRHDEDGTWAYIEYAIKKKVVIFEGYPSVDFSFKYTFCVRLGSDGGSELEPVLAFVEEHQMETEKVILVLSGAVAVAIAFKMGLVAGGFSALASAFIGIVQNVTKIVFA